MNKETEKTCNIKNSSFFVAIDFKNFKPYLTNNMQFYVVTRIPLVIVPGGSM